MVVSGLIPFRAFHVFDWEKLALRRDRLLALRNEAIRKPTNQPTNRYYQLQRFQALGLFGCKVFTLNTTNKPTEITSNVT